jgi:hypothetical protein
MLAGDNADTAAGRAGFKASGRNTPGHRLAQAVWRLTGAACNARVNGRGVAAPEQLAASVGRSIGEPVTRVLPAGQWRQVLRKVSARRRGPLLGSFAGRLFMTLGEVV